VNLQQLLDFAFKNYPDEVLLLHPDTVVRSNDKRPAQVRFKVPDELVKHLKGDGSDKMIMFAVIVPANIAERAVSPILLHNEVK
jgi:hypothetical protein